MTFYPGDKVYYTPSNREYIVKKCYFVVCDDVKLELIDVKPLTKHKGDEVRRFEGYNSEYFKLVKHD